MAEIDFEESSGNVFADLSFSPKDAEGLTALGQDVEITVTPASAIRHVWLHVLAYGGVDKP